MMGVMSDEMPERSSSVRRSTGVDIVRQGGKTVRREVEVTHRHYPGGKGATSDELNEVEERRKARLKEYAVWKESRQAAHEKGDPRKSA